MNRRRVRWSVFGAVALFAAVGGAWIFSLPPGREVGVAPPIPKEEVDAMLAVLKPPKRERPLIAIVGLNAGTEATDYLMPFGILRRADVADVVALAIESGPVKLYPALQVEPHATVAEFDARHSEGADYVIVPAMSRDDDPTVMAWIKSQVAKRAIVVSVCAGAKVVAAAGLLDGKRATTHWYYLEELREDHPTVRYVPNRRLVVDDGVVTTTGITASMPMMLTLIEAIAGREKAEAIGRDLGVMQWDTRHDSDAFQFTRAFALTAMANRLAFWKREELGIEVTPGIDEVTLALVSDAWSRTYRSRAVTFAGSAGPVKTRAGLRLIPDRVAASWPVEQRLPAIGERPPAEALEHALGEIATRYGTPTANFVAQQLEYPRRERPELPDRREQDRR